MKTLMNEPLIQNYSVILSYQKRNGSDKSNLVLFQKCYIRVLKWTYYKERAIYIAMSIGSAILTRLKI